MFPSKAKETLITVETPDCSTDQVSKDRVKALAKCVTPTYPTQLTAEVSLGGEDARLGDLSRRRVSKGPRERSLSTRRFGRETWGSAGISSAYFGQRELCFIAYLSWRTKYHRFICSKLSTLSCAGCV